VLEEAFIEAVTDPSQRRSKSKLLYSMTAGGSDASAATGGIEQWDLTDAVSPYLDRHMIFPLLEFVDERIAAKAVSYNSRDVAEARLALLRPTHMVDYAVDVYRSIHGEADIPKDFAEQKERVYQELEALRAQCEPLDKLVKDDEERVSCSIIMLLLSMLWMTDDRHSY